MLSKIAHVQSKKKTSKTKSQGTGGGDYVGFRLSMSNVIYFVFISLEPYIVSV